MTIRIVQNSRTNMQTINFSGVETGITVAGLSFHPEQAYGSGGDTYPRLMVPLKLHVYPHNIPLTDYVYTDISAQLLTNPGHKIADSLHLRLQRIQRGIHPYTFDQQLTLEFLLDSKRISHLEQLRKGGNLSLNIDVQLQVEKHSVIEAEKNRPAVWGLQYLHQLSLSSSITFPQGDWVSRVLPNIGYGKIHVFEIPAIPLENNLESQKCFEALKQAQERHLVGLYDDAVGKCRIALDPYFDYVALDPTQSTSQKIPILKKHWETTLGTATYTWLNEVFKGLKQATNLPHHVPTAHFSQMDSLMIQSITIAVLSYAARVSHLKGK